MSAAKTNLPSHEAGAHIPDLSPENPAVTWAKENKGYLAFLLLVITVTASWNYFWPRYKRQDLGASWSLYQELAQPANFTADKIEETLSRARGDERIFPWLVQTGVSAAIQQEDLDALRILRGELEKLAQDPDLEGFRVVGDAGLEPLFAHTLARVDQALDPNSTREFVNPAPTGPKVRFTVQVNGQDDYTFEAGLYPEAAPEACAWFLEAARNGDLVGRPGTRQGSFSFQFSAEQPEGSEAKSLPLEVQWGFFHLQGALWLSRDTGGKPTEMKAGAFELGIMDAPHLDGQTTVFGHLTSGAEQLAGFAYQGPDQPDPIDSMILTSIEVLE
ncbi:MAG: hypothetical protein D6702_01450 [Planctomycetota bacterium]|nr:MAG: hypothetical protein D6702_01450 [Planctomycetota bacterium]